MPIPRELLRLTEQELGELLASARTLHLATVGSDGSPHVTPLWFVWRDGALWVNSLIRSRRTTDLRAGSPVAVCVDAGEAYGELRGAVLRGRFADASDDPGLDDAERIFGEKYFGTPEIPRMRSHMWLKLVPDSVASWDFGKIPAGRDQRLGSDRSAPSA